MRWAPDPDFALQTRLSLSPSGRYGWAAAISICIDGVNELES
jgi:hypothetical protein